MNCEYSFEVPQQGSSDEYHNTCFGGEIRKVSLQYFLVEKSALSRAVRMSSAAGTLRVKCFIMNRLRKKPFFLLRNTK